MWRSENERSRARSRSSSTSSPGSISTASPVSSHAKTNPFLKNGATARVSIIMTSMILAIVDDLMFTSKIRTTAGRLGVPVAFARSRDAALTGMRATRPTLVIVDLNSRGADPLGTLTAMRGDPALADIPTIGFVSHVQTDLIDAARQAGIGEVMARSAFTARLPEILQGAGSDRP